MISNYEKSYVNRIIKDIETQIERLSNLDYNKYSETICYLFDAKSSLEGELEESK
jgi:hypothetical protein